MRWHAPVDPNCPVVQEFYDSLYGDPLTAAIGAPVEDISEDFDNEHRAECERCQNYGAANIEVAQ